MQSSVIYLLFIYICKHHKYAKTWSMDELNISVVTIYMTIILTGWIKNGMDMQGLLWASPFQFSRKDFTGCYTVWLTNQEETWYYTKIDQLFVTMDRNIKASRKRSYRITEWRIGECCVFNWNRTREPFTC